MPPETLPGLNVAVCDTEKQIRTVYSPRVVIIQPGGQFILVRYADTPWLGLPGGKVKVEEYGPDDNLSCAAALRTLGRKVQEECGLRIHFDRSNCQRLGWIEMNAVDNVQRTITQHRITIFRYTAGEINKPELEEGVTIANIYDHLAGPLFPDARIVVYHLRHLNRPRMPISPQRIWPKRPIFFQMEPTVGPLLGAPDWYKQG